MDKKVLKPVNQKSVYHSFADLYETSMQQNDIEMAIKSLSGMNQTFALEIKLSFLKGQNKIRPVELKSVDENTTDKPFDRAITGDEFE